MKRFIKYLIIATFIFAIVPFGVKAASGSAYLNGASSIIAGNTANITLGFNGSDKVAGVQYTVTASGNLQIVSVNALNGTSVSKSGDNVIQVIFANEGLASGTAWANIVVKVPSGAAAGSTGTLTISNIGLSLDNNPATTYASNVSKTITVAQAPVVNPTPTPNVPTTPTTPQAPTKSNDATLKDLVIQNDDKFTFNKETTSYVVNVGNDVTSLDLTATLNNSKATYVVSGNENFVVGRNYVTITVTAEDGTQKVYNLEVIRESEKCEMIGDNSGNEKLIWIIISCVLATLLIAETSYIIYDKKIANSEE